VDESVWRARSAREKVILWALIDWIELERIHGFVVEENPSDSVSAIQGKTLDLIRSVVSDGLFLLGDLNRSDHRFGAWEGTLDESMQRIRRRYVDAFEDDGWWRWFCWLEATERGVRVARALEAKLLE
jgi:hypothetical protein